MISVVLVTYNRVKFLELAIQDILKQSFQDFELIICDDASPDNTEQICKKYCELDTRISYIRQENNKRMPANLNVGLKAAKYPYIAILHDGDRFAPNLLQRWYNAIRENPNVAFVFNLLANFDNKENQWNEPSLFPEGVLEGKAFLKKFYFRNGRFSSAVWGETLVRKKHLEAYGYLNEAYGFYADVDLWMGLLQKYDAYFCNEPLIFCPIKDIQPHQFDDRTIKIFFLLKGMSYRQRIQTFSHNKCVLFLEIIIFFALSAYGYTYHLLTIAKNHNFKSYLDAGKITYENRSVLLLCWLIIIPVSFTFATLKLISSQTVS